MNRFKTSLLALAVLAALSLAWAQTSKAPAPKGAAHAATMTIVQPESLKWGPLVPGCEMAVVYGNLDQPGALFTIRIKCADGAKIPPHWHPKDEHVTVLKGTFMLGMGEKFDAGATKPYAPGNYVAIPKQMRHFGWSKGETIVQVHGEGPFQVIFVNPADDPRNQAKAPAKK